MDSDRAAILKIAVALGLIVVFLVAWFLTIGAPAPDEPEEEAIESSADVEDVVALGAVHPDEAPDAPCEPTVCGACPHPAVS